MKKKTKFSKQFQKKIKCKKQTENSVTGSQEMLMQRVRNQAAKEKRQVVLDTSSDLKMSEIIIHFASPLLESVEPGPDREKSLIVAITLWNLTMIPESKQQGLIDSTFSKIYGKDYPPDFEQIIDYFLERKQALYPDVNQVILDYDYVQTAEGDQLNVVSNAE